MQYKFEKLDLLGLVTTDTSNIIDPTAKADVLRQASGIWADAPIDVSVDPNKIQPIYTDGKQVVLPMVSGSILAVVRLSPDHGYKPACALYHITVNDNSDDEKQKQEVVEKDSLYKGIPISTYATQNGAYTTNDGEQYVFIVPVTKNNKTYSVRAIKIHTTIRRDHLGRYVIPSYMLFWQDKLRDDNGMYLAPDSIYQDTLIHAAQQVGQFARRKHN